MSDKVRKSKIVQGVVVPAEALAVHVDGTEAELPLTTEQPVALTDPLASVEEHRGAIATSDNRRYLQVQPYDPRLAAVIVARVAEGHTLTQVLDEYGLSWGTLRRWEARKERFKAALNEARTLASYRLADEALDEASKETGSMPEAMARKLRVETLKWAASKANPVTFGDRVQVDATLDLGKVLDATFKVAKAPSLEPIEAETTEPEPDRDTP